MVSSADRSCQARRAVIEQGVQHGRHNEGVVDPFACRRVQPRVRIECLLEHHGAAAAQGGQYRQRPGMRDGRGQQETGALGETPGGGQGVGLLDERPVGDHHAFGSAGGAARVLQPGRVLFARRSPYEPAGRDLLAERQQVFTCLGRAEGQEMLDASAPGGELGAGLRELRVHDEDGNTGVVADVGVVAERPQGVQPGVGAAEQVGRGLRQPHLGRVRAQRRHGPAGADPARSEQRHDAADRRRGAGVGYAPVSQHERLPVREAL